MVEKSLDGLLRTSLHNARNYTRSVVYNMFQEVMLDLVCQRLFREMLDDHIVKISDNIAVFEGMSKGRGSTVLLCVEGAW